MDKISAHIVGENISSNSVEAFSLHKKSHFGEPLGEQIQYSLSETLFLVERKKWMSFMERKKSHQKN